MNETNRKSRILLIILLVAALTLLSIGVDFFWVHRIHSAGEEERASSRTVKVPEVLLVNKQTLRFPMTVKQLQDAGWTEDDSLSVLLDSNRSNDSVSFFKNGCTIQFVLHNTNAARSPLSDCQVIGVNDESPDRTHTISLENGLTCRKSTRKDIEEQYGKCRYSSTYADSTSLTYYGEDSNSFHLFLTNGKLTRIQFSVTPELDATAPDVLSAQAAAWKAPAAMPDRLRNTTLSLDGALYRLPAPLNAFLKEGWQLSLQDSTYDASTRKSLSRKGLYPEESVHLLLLKGDTQLRICLQNDGREMVNFASCAVTEVEIPEDETVRFRLPGGIQNKTTTAQLKRAMKRMDVDCRSTQYSSFTSFTVHLTQPGSQSTSSGYISIDAGDTGIQTLDMICYGEVSWMSD